MLHRTPMLAAASTTLLLSITSALQAAPLDPGQLLVSEVLVNPGATSDTAGEWFELYNNSTETIDLNGLIISDDGSNSHTLSSVNPLLLDPGAYFVLGRNADESVNGGYTPDYIYTDFVLSNSADEIVLVYDGEEAFRLAYTSSDNFDPVGYAMVLQTISSDIDAQSYQIAIEDAVYGSGDRGTPGSGPFSPPVSTVPVPGAGWLFMSSLGLVGALVRGRKS